jgi:DNA-binding Lrp family transcriptional regulator
MTSGAIRDSIDHKLLTLLQQDARASLTTLARAVCLSRTAVQGRMARLEREGVIVGYRAVLGAAHRAGSGLNALLAITFSQRPCTPVVEKFRPWPEIVHYYSVTGPIDAYVLVNVKDVAALGSLVHRFSAIQGIASVSSSVVLESS